MLGESLPTANMIDVGPADGLVTGVVFLLNGAGAALSALPGRYKLAACVPWAAMLVCLGVYLEGLDGRAPWPDFVKTCFVVWALLLAIPFAVAAKRSIKREGHDESHGRVADEPSDSR